MHVTKSVVFGLVSLVCSIDATKATGKPVLAKRQQIMASVTNDGCTAVCYDLSNLDNGLDSECEVWCTEGFSTKMPVTSTSTSTVISTVTTSAEAALNRRTVVSATNGDCTAICWDLMPGTECDVQCSSDFQTKMPGNVVHPSGANGSIACIDLPRTRIFSTPSHSTLHTYADFSFLQYPVKPLVQLTSMLVRTFRVCSSLLLVAEVV